jgi:hypothetical protein
MRHPAGRLEDLSLDETRTRKDMACFLSGVTIAAGVVASTRVAIASLGGTSLVGLAPGNLMAILQGRARRVMWMFWTGIENFAGDLAGTTAPVATGLVVARTASHFPGIYAGCSLVRAHRLTISSLEN